MFSIPSDERLLPYAFFIEIAIGCELKYSAFAAVSSNCDSLMSLLLTLTTSNFPLVIVPVLSKIIVCTPESFSMYELPFISIPFFEAEPLFSLICDCLVVLL